MSNPTQLINVVLQYSWFLMMGQRAYGNTLLARMILKYHLIEQNVEQFSHAGATPFGYMDLGKELGHTGDSQMAQSIFDGTLKHAAFSESPIHAIVEQLRKHPASIIYLNQW
jgi:hypothetical protein